MTTPQNQLHDMIYKLNRIQTMIEGDEDEDGLFITINQIQIQVADLMASNQRIENILNLIVKLLDKNE